MYDEEAVYQDADIEQAELEAEGRRLAALRRAGICTHGWTQSYTAEYRPDLAPGKVECLHCHTVFESREAADWAAREARL